MFKQLVFAIGLFGLAISHLPEVVDAMFDEPETDPRPWEEKEPEKTWYTLAPTSKEPVMTKTIQDLMRSPFNQGGLSEDGERRYLELAFLSGYCGGFLPTQALSDELWALEANANPTQTSKKIDYAEDGHALRREEQEPARQALLAWLEDGAPDKA